MTARASMPYLIAAALAASLAGCAATSGPGDDSAGGVFVAPDRYVLYNCDQLATRAGVVAAREKELRELTAQAGTTADGQVVSALAYRPEYLSLRGDMVELRKTAIAKSCRSMPVMDEPVGRASDRAVR